MWNKYKNSKPALVLLSVFCAVALWLFVDITTEPDAYNTVTAIPVTFVNEEELNERGLRIDEGHDATITLKLTGIRAVISQLNKSNISIVVDTDQITEAGEQNLTYDPVFPNTATLSKFRITDRSSTTIPVKVVRIATRELPVTGVFNGSVAQDLLYDLNGFEMEQDTITVTGEENLLSQVAKAEVVLSEKELSDSWSGRLPIRLLDETGNELDQTGLTLSHADIAVLFPVRRVKELPLKVKILSGGGASEQDIEYTLSQKSILVSGTQSVLNGVDSIVLGTIDLSRIVTKETFDFPINLMDGLISEDSVNHVTVTVTVSGLVTRRMEVTDLRLTNVPAGMQAQLKTEKLMTRIRGRSETMALLTENDVYAEVDLSQLAAGAEGSCVVPAQIRVRGMSDIGAIDECSAIVEISAQPEVGQ